MVRRRDLLAAGVAAALLAACPRRQNPTPQVVDPDDYDAFWLWAGVKPQPVLDRAKTLYLVAAEKRANGHWHELRPQPPAFDHAGLWMVLRLETLDWDKQDFARTVAWAKEWQANNPRFVGVQIDFDAATKSLDRYATFLRQLRVELPDDMALGITGLLDWSAQGDPEHLAELADVIDEAVFQLYQGRAMIPGYANWLRRLDQMPMPFKLGLVQGGEWDAPDDLDQNPNFRGFVIFLVNP